MIFSIKKLSGTEKAFCLKTISSKAMFAIVGDAIVNRKSMSIVRMGDGERGILEADKTKPFTRFNYIRPDWNKKLGIEGASTSSLQKSIIKAGNSCTYFAPSVSGISLREYYLYDYFKPRPLYLDNFYVNDWTPKMIEMLFRASEGVFIIHKDYQKIIKNFKKNYNFDRKSGVKFAGFAKRNWSDNEQAIEAAITSGMQLILYSAGPGGKIIGPAIAKTKNKIVLDVGNTLLPWSLRGKIDSTD